MYIYIYIYNFNCIYIFLLYVLIKHVVVNSLRQRETFWKVSNIFPVVKVNAKEWHWCACTTPI